MDYAACNIVYVDRTAGEDRLLKRGDIISKPIDGDLTASRDQNGPGEIDVNDNLQTLLGTFSEGKKTPPVPRPNRLS
jgi:3',5'-cyclic-nucleotide phosphodiesterase